jgi:hypothetical protein
MDSRDILVKQEEEYARTLRILRYDPDEINDLIYIFRKSKEYDESTINLSNESMFGYPQPGSIKRKENEKTWIDKRSKEYMAPFGFKDHKVVLPMKYKWIVDSEGNPDIELIHNLCMLSSNVYFWYLLTYPQKSKLYWLLMDNPKKKVFGYNDPFFTFGDLIDLLNRYVFIRDNQQTILSCIRYERKNTIDITHEMKTMLDNNIERMISLEKQENYFFQPMTSDVQIERNLRPYRAFIYNFIKDWLQLFDIENKGGLDGRPNIKAVYVFTSFAGRQ